jgi:uncharacterized glyoxalase superfamily protein PhnB
MALNECIVLLSPAEDGITDDKLTYEDSVSSGAELRVGADKEFLVELQEMPFGIYGRFTDRFGMEWYFRGAR